MKRIETPLQASILLDAFNSPITLTGNTALQEQSPQWLRVLYACLTSPSFLLLLSFLFSKVFPDVITLLKIVLA